MDGGGSCLGCWLWAKPPTQHWGLCWMARKRGKPTPCLEGRGGLRKANGLGAPQANHTSKRPRIFPFLGRDPRESPLPHLPSSGSAPSRALGGLCRGGGKPAALSGDGARGHHHAGERTKRGRRAGALPGHPAGNP